MELQMNTQVLKDTLIGKYLVKTIRVCDLIGMYFSPHQNPADENMSYIHLQCQMRIIQSNKVLVSSEEMYLALDAKNKEFHYDTDDSLFDEKMSQFVENHQTIPVADVVACDNGDLFVQFSDGCIVQAIANSTDSEDELWRFSLNQETPHLIRTVNGFEQSE